MIEKKKNLQRKQNVQLERSDKTKKERSFVSQRRECIEEDIYMLERKDILLVAFL